MLRRNEPVIVAQRARLDALLGAHVSRGAPYCLLDFPDHSNVGDSAIYAGELVLLEALTGRRPDYVCTYGSFDRARLEAACPEGTIFIHGGGNFGDIWPAHQAFREAVMAALPHRRIIQLPQSLHFQDGAARDRCARAISAHGDFHLWVRDAKSEEIARNAFDCAVELSPDSAFALGPLARRGAADVDVLALLRTDVERVELDLAAFEAIDARVVDWVDERRPTVLARGANRLRDLIDGGLSAEAREERRYARRAMARVERGLRLLSQGRTVITDRLHAHILATLLDIPHVALDNMYGKIANYRAAWTSGYAGARVAGDVAQAVNELSRLAAPAAAAA